MAKITTINISNAKQRQNQKENQNKIDEKQ